MAVARHLPRGRLQAGDRHLKSNKIWDNLLAGAAGISSIPTLMVFRAGILVFSEPGALPKAALQQVIEGVRALDMDDVGRQVAEHAATVADQTMAQS